MNEKLQRGFRLGEFSVHPPQGLITRSGASTHIRPQVMEALLVLAEQPGEIVGRDDFAHRIWGRNSPSDDAISHCISELRQALDDHSDNPRFIQTLPKRGYRLVCDISPLDDAPSEEGSSTLSIDDNQEDPPSILAILQDLKRRRVFKVAAAYAVVAWVMLQVSELIFDALALPPWTMRFAVLMAIIGFPIVALFAWAFQLTPEGQVVVDLQLHDEGAYRKHRQADLFIIVILSVTISLLLYALFAGQISDTTTTEAYDKPPVVAERDGPIVPREISEKSIAVLRFINIGDPAFNYISDGLSEELLHRFTKLTQLFVASRTSTWALPAGLDHKSIRERLGVRYILEGSIRPIEDELRVTVQLIDTDTGFHAWSETYDSRLDDILLLENQVAVAVVRAVGFELSDEVAATLEQHPTDNPDAYLKYLQGLNYLRMSRQEENLSKAEAFFSEALEIDSRFTLAYAGRCELSLARYRLTRATEQFEAAERDCHRALTLDADLKEVYSALGSLYRHSGQFDKAEIEFKKALSIDPLYEDANYGLARCYQGQGHLERAEQTLRAGIQMEPGYWGTYMALGYFLHQFGRYDEAIPYFEAVTELTPDSPDGFTNLGTALYDLGEWEQAANQWRRSVEIKPSAVSYRNLGTLYYYNGDFEEATRMYGEGIALAPNDHWLRGKRAAAFRYIDGASESSRNDYEKAIELANERLKINPEDANTLAYLAAYYVNTDQFAKARKSIARAVELEENNPEVWYFSAIVNVRSSNFGLAISDIEKAVELGYSRRLLRAERQFEALQDNEAFVALVKD